MQLFYDRMDCSPPAFLCPWDSPGKTTGVGGHALLQGTFLTQGLNLRVLCHATMTGRRLAAPETQDGALSMPRANHPIRQKQQETSNVVSPPASWAPFPRASYKDAQSWSLGTNRQTWALTHLSASFHTAGRRSGYQFANRPDLGGTCFQTSSLSDFKVHPPRSPVWLACLLLRCDSVACLHLRSCEPCLAGGQMWPSGKTPAWTLCGRLLAVTMGSPGRESILFSLLAAPTRSS